MSQFLIFVSIIAGAALSAAEDDSRLKTNLPEPVTYYKLPDLKPGADEAHKTGDHEPRFGVHLGYGNDIQGYSGGNVLGNYTPLKIDLGGLVIGTVIGLGAVLLAPKLLHIFSSPHHGGHGGPSFRSDGETVFSSIGNVISRIDETLQKHEIDAMSCLQKLACSMARPANDAADSNNTRNPLFDLLLDGSKLKSAMERGERGEDCAEAYRHCTSPSNSRANGNQL